MLVFLGNLKNAPYCETLHVNGTQNVSIFYRCCVPFVAITDYFLNGPMTPITRKYLLVESQNVIRNQSYTKRNYVFKKGQISLKFLHDALLQ